jgi:hypothetical protein
LKRSEGIKRGIPEHKVSRWPKMTVRRDKIEENVWE